VSDAPLDATLSEGTAGTALGDALAPERTAFALVDDRQSGDAGLDAYTRAMPDGYDAERARLRELTRRERAVATKYYHLGQTQTWPYVAGTLVGFVAWLSLWPLAIMGILPLWLGTILSTLAIIGGWLVAHEAMHDTLGRRGTRAHFWNELTGQLALFPLLFPLSIARITHLAHHKYCADPLRDPDYPDVAPSFMGTIFKVWLNRQPNPSGQIHHVRRVIYDVIGTEEAKKAFRTTMLVQLAAISFWIALAETGHAMEAAMLWWLPRWLALIQIRVGFSWEPHHPHDMTGRYTHTRVFRSRFGRVLSMGIEGHLAHHLFPHVPMHLTPAMLRELSPMLAERGVDIAQLREGWTIGEVVKG